MINNLNQKRRYNLFIINIIQASWPHRWATCPQGLKVSKRTAQRYIENIIIKENKKSTFLEDVFDLIISRHQNDNITTDDNNDLITEYFTEEEYKEFHKRTSESLTDNFESFKSIIINK